MAVLTERSSAVDSTTKMISDQDDVCSQVVRAEVELLTGCSRASGNRQKGPPHRRRSYRWPR